MRYKIMRLICMFDLPVETGTERREYRFFRKRLLKEGFSMMQYSIYTRVCPNREYAQSLQKRLGHYLPTGGNIRLLIITEKQYDDMVLLVGSKSLTEQKIGAERMIIL